MFSQLLGLGFGTQDKASDLSDRLSGALGGGLGLGLGAGLLGSLLFGGRKRRFGKLAGLGALGAVGALAYKAIREAQESRSRRRVENETIVVPGVVREHEELPLEPPPFDSAFVPRDEAEAQALGLLLVRAMIAGAMADGRIDQTESARIHAEIGALDLEPEDKALLLDEFRSPATIEELAAGARGEEQAAEVYAASLLAVQVDGALERSHFRRLAKALRLDDDVVRSLERNARALD